MSMEWKMFCPFALTLCKLCLWDGKCSLLFCFYYVLIMSVEFKVFFNFTCKNVPTE